ncbi:hypothetical protein [Allosphingosinicella deserti]|uniref:Uncharacterized protein n=1 Tax=Allosphingosinicella deserti TaxID=2116704 RepID=A0A2P7R023_9SPHN|nr:hypothetical protein [Sphingomonas deserti]PSJ43558.1 hypothetical protein C7I55_04190 [Sphingomonas deserti]
MKRPDISTRVARAKIVALPALLISLSNAVCAQEKGAGAIDDFEQALAAEAAPAARSENASAALPEPAAAPLPDRSPPPSGGIARQLHPLAGLAPVTPQQVADAIVTCAALVHGHIIAPAALHQRGWESVAGTAPDGAPDAQYFARPSGDLQIVVPRSGDSARTCSTYGIVGSAANKAKLEQLLVARFGPSLKPATPFLSRQSVSWNTDDAEIMVDVSPLMRGGIYRASVIVLPKSMSRSLKGR